MTSELLESYRCAEQVTREHARSFYFASFALPKVKKLHAFGLYAFCRHVDDVIDRSPPNQRNEMIDQLRVLVKGLESGRTLHNTMLPWFEAFYHTYHVCEIDNWMLNDLLTGVAMDCKTVRIKTCEELDRYCYHVAGVVGLMMTRIFGLKNSSAEPQAIDMGKAMQITNILRDIREDFENDRIYLAEEDMERFGFSHECLALALQSDSYDRVRWQEFIFYMINKARSLYVSAHCGLELLMDDGSKMTAAWMSRIYAGILDRIEAEPHSVLHRRLSVSTFGKVQLAFCTVLNLRYGFRL